MRTQVQIPKIRLKSQAWHNTAGIPVLGRPRQVDPWSLLAWHMGWWVSSRFQWETVLPACVHTHTHSHLHTYEYSTHTHEHWEKSWCPFLSRPVLNVCDLWAKSAVPYGALGLWKGDDVFLDICLFNTSRNLMQMCAAHPADLSSACIPISARSLITSVIPGPE